MKGLWACLIVSGLLIPAQVMLFALNVERGAIGFGILNALMVALNVVTIFVCRRGLRALREAEELRRRTSELKGQQP